MFNDDVLCICQRNLCVSIYVCYKQCELYTLIFYNIYLYKNAQLTKNVLTVISSKLHAVRLRLNMTIIMNLCKLYNQWVWDDTVSSRYDTYSIRTLPIRYVFDTIHILEFWISTTRWMFWVDLYNEWPLNPTNTSANAPV